MAITKKGKNVLVALSKKYGKVKAVKIMHESIEKDAPGSKEWYEQEAATNKYTDVL